MKNKRYSLVSLIAFVLVFVMLTSAISYLSGGFRDWNAKDWFNINSDKKTELPEAESEAIVLDSAGNEMIAGKVYPMSSSMRFMSFAPMAESQPKTVSIKVEPYPVYAINAKIDWSVAWSGADAGNWSVGKNVSDYVSVRTLVDGSYNALVDFKLNFGRSIKLSAAVRGNESVFSDCMVDCLGVISDLSLSAVIKGKTASVPSISSALSVSYPITYTPGSPSSYSYLWKQANFSGDSYILEDWFLSPSMVVSSESVFTPSFSSDYTVIDNFTYTATLKSSTAFYQRTRSPEFGSFLSSCNLFNSNYGFGIVSAMQIYGANDEDATEAAGAIKTTNKGINNAISIIDIPIFTLVLQAESANTTFTKEIALYLSPDWSSNPASLSLDSNDLIFGG